MTYEFDSPSNKKNREEMRKRDDYASRNIEPGLKGLMDQVRRRFQVKVKEMTDDEIDDNFDSIFDECVRMIPGAAEAFEIWDKLFNEYQPK